MKFIAAMLIYLFSIGIWTLASYFTFKWKIHKLSKLVIVGLLIVWVTTIFNIVYTGLMGWNFTPQSDLEALLDSITFVVEMIGIIIWYVGLTIGLKKNTLK